MLLKFIRASRKGALPVGALGRLRTRFTRPMLCAKEAPLATQVCTVCETTTTTRVLRNHRLARARRHRRPILHENHRLVVKGLPAVIGGQRRQHSQNNCTVQRTRSPAQVSRPVLKELVHGMTLHAQDKVQPAPTKQQTHRPASNLRIGKEDPRKPFWRNREIPSNWMRIVFHLKTFVKT